MKKAILIASTAVLLLFGAAPGASADLVLGSYGSGAGQYQNAQGVAVDTSSGETASGRVYVADTGNNRVDVFDEAGAFLFSFGSLGTGAGQLKSPNAIAVDPASHAVYVADQVVLLSPRPGRIYKTIRPDIPRSGSPEAIRRDQVYLDTVEEIWQVLKQYVA